MRPTPFHQSAEAEAASRRALLISYHFPPGSSAGALRWEKFVAIGCERGWRFDVVTADPTQLSHPDESRLRSLPPGLRLFGIEERFPLLGRIERRLTRYRRTGREPASAGPPTQRTSDRPKSLSREEVMRTSRFSKRALIRSFFAWQRGGADAIWARDAYRVGAALAADADYDVVVTCGPPHASHVAGTRLTRRFGIPHVVDMRDPWSLVERLPEPAASRGWFRRARRDERRVTSRAALVVCNTEPAAESLRAIAGGTPVLAVWNGYDDEPLPEPERDGTFRVAYAGMIYLDRDPSPVFRASARVIRDLGLGPDEFRVEFMGSVEGGDIEQLARDNGLDGHFVWHRRGTRSEAQEFLAGSSVLVSLFQDSHMAIPSKVFEYMRFPAWVIAMAEPGSATGIALRDSGAAVVDPRDESALAGILEDRFRRFSDGDRPERPEWSERYSRRAQGEALFDALEALNSGD